MDIHPELKEPLTPKLSYENVHYWRCEDSGYHTSFTPESLECSEISNSTKFTHKIRFAEHLHFDYYDISKEITYGTACKDSHIRPHDNKPSVQNRRGIKRAFQEEPEDININDTNKTPTSAISSAMRKMRFKSIETNKVTNFNSIKIGRDLYYSNENVNHTEIPTTPIKKVCNNRRKPCSPVDVKKKLNLEMHSLCCDRQSLLPINKCSEENTKKYNFKPTQKIDIIKLLYTNKVVPPIIEIFNYLLPQDIINFKSVSTYWRKIWNHLSIKQKKEEYLNFLEIVKENQENKSSTPKNNNTNHKRPLMETNNLCNLNQKKSLNSPPGTPRTTKFKKYAKVSKFKCRIFSFVHTVKIDK